MIPTRQLKLGSPSSPSTFLWVTLLLLGNATYHIIRAARLEMMMNDDDDNTTIKVDTYDTRYLLS